MTKTNKHEIKFMVDYRYRYRHMLIGSVDILKVSRVYSINVRPSYRRGGSIGGE